MKKYLLTIFAALLIAGCASNGESEVQASAEEVGTAEEVMAGEKKYFCSSEHVVGTNFKRRRCRTKAQIEEEREVAQKELSSMQRSGMTAPVDN
ncbi:lipoprotein [Pseudidiomarina homiensis]|uniref:Lipoprotein n=1 Tax=Pseudidiomarina homiensis TaxID=364198 RepID=A0A432Y6E2_9GAMM|nr:lipoprotein [Pseudidiomarina homiensis]RUO56550.1 hypothetical protein CWI70_07370 [Pseudidiomarina homiensis]